MPKNSSKIDLASVVAELKKRSQWNISSYLFDKQLEFVNDPSPFKCAVTSRRAGKTVSCAADLFSTAISTPESVGLYITLSRSNAKKIIWTELKRLARQFRIKVRFNESELSVTFPNRSVLYCSGASDKTEIEKFRGLALKKVYVDECQSFHSYLEDLINEVISPALMDYNGSLSLIGTPGPVPSGFFWDCTRNLSYSSHYWTFFDNPYLVAKSGISHQQMLDRELKKRGVSAEHPSIQREWFGKWAYDADSLVYKYNASVNDYGATPNFTNYVLGIDIGYDDSDAIGVLAWGEENSNTYLLEEKITQHQGITELVQQIEYFKKKYDISRIIVDTAGLGKKIGEEISRRYGITIQPAEKVRKLEYIELMNDALRTGRLKAKVGSRFAQDCMRVEWDLDKSRPDKKVISNRFHSDICEAVLYAWRDSYSFTYSPPEEKPKEGSKEWEEELEAKAFEYFSRLEDDPYGIK